MKKRRQIRRQERGASLTEFALVVPLFVALIYGSLYLTDLGVFKLKAQEVARYSTWAFTTRPLSNFGAEQLSAGAHNDYFDDAQNSVAEELDEIYFDLDGARNRLLPIPGAWSKTMAATYETPGSLDLRNGRTDVVPDWANVSMGEPFSALWWILSMMGIGNDVNSLVSGPFERLGFNVRGQITGRANVSILPPFRPEDARAAMAMAEAGAERGADLSPWNPTVRRQIRDNNQLLSNTLVADPWRVNQGWSAHPAKAGGQSRERAHFANVVKQVNNEAILAFPGGSVLGIILGVRDAQKFIPPGLAQIFGGIPPNLPEAHVFSRPYTEAENRDQRQPWVESPLAKGQVDIFNETDTDPEDGAVRRFESMPMYSDPVHPEESEYLRALRERGANFMGCPQEGTRGCWE
ncbi:TadE/TadG family type IV pilus assembly protein [Myxococcota bacterium]